MLVTVAGLWACVGSGLFAAPAFAGGVNTSDDSGPYSAAVYNHTPYTWTLVAQNAPSTPGSFCYNSGYTRTCWITPPAQTIAPGAAMGYSLHANQVQQSPVSGLFGTLWGYDGYMTYRVNVVGSAPEYVTIGVSQAQTIGTWFGTCCAQVVLRQFFTTAPPSANYDPAVNVDAPPAQPTANPQLAFQEAVPTNYDLTYTLASGDYKIDASQDQGSPFVELLNNVCGGDNGQNACSFTQTGPLTWGIGTAVKSGQALNCVVTGGKRASPSGADGAEPPPATEPNWFEVEYKAAQTASLSVGGGATATTEFNLFDIIKGKISVKVEAEHEWTEEKAFTRSTRVYIPDNNIATIWVAPTEGKVTGTLVVKLGSAKFTATNFTETRDGVSRGDLTPAFNVITKTRPMTAAEFADNCKHQSSSATELGLGAPKKLAWPKGRPPVRLVPGQGVARVKLGQTQAQVARQLGRPQASRFPLRPCQALGSGCFAQAGLGGTWLYPKLRVVFGPDRRVSGLIYRGAKLSGKRIGVGTRLTRLRAAYPRVSCTKHAKQGFCTLPGKYAGRAVRTVFRINTTRAGGDRCDRVQIYVFVGHSRRVDS